MTQVSPVEGRLSTSRCVARYPPAMPSATRVPLVILMASALAASGCGPEGPRDPGGERADPVALLTVLPTANGLVDDGGPRVPEPTDLLDALTGSRDRAVADRMVSAGLAESGVRRWTATAGGTMAASVTVWPTKAIAFNFGLQVAQEDLGEPGVAAWTPSDVPGSQGTRQRDGERVRVLARTIGPNAIVVRATGAVPDAVVAKAMERLIRVQEARG